MPVRECPFCHENIPVLAYPAHRATHTALRPDGQQQEHITLREDKRYTGSLDGVPQVYHHPKCGKSTRMPEEIIRSYLVNPNMYNSTIFCVGCRRYVPYGEVYWVETNESLEDYFSALKKSKGTE